MSGNAKQMARSATATAEDLSDNQPRDLDAPWFGGAWGTGVQKAQSMSQNRAQRPRMNTEVPDSFDWGVAELGEFWEKCFWDSYNSYAQDGLHPKCLCSKICNDVLSTNININSSSSNPNDRILCFEVLGMLETKFIEMGVIQTPVPKEGSTNANHMVYQRVLASDLKKLEKYLEPKPGGLEAWARGVVEECIQRLSAR